MVKLILAVLIIILIGAGLYFFVINKGALPLKPTASTTESQVQSQPQITGNNNAVATSPEDDVNALNQDLQEFDKADAASLQDLNNL